MAKLNQGTAAHCCLTCGAAQWPDGPDRGLCFEPRHKCKAAKAIREVNVCCYWQPLRTHFDRPTSLADRIFAVLYFSNGNAPRGCREICHAIDLEFGGHTFAPDVARMLEHHNRQGQVVQTPDKGKPLHEYVNWITAYTAILGPSDRVVRFTLSQTTAEAFADRFGAYCSERGTVHPACGGVA